MEQLISPIDVLKKEHEEIERELLELKTISESKAINYPNLIHVLKILTNKWDEHEEKEEKFFPVLEKERFSVPVEKMQFEHNKLRPHKKAIIDALKSGSEKEVKDALKVHGTIINHELFNHIRDEENVLYAITLEEFSSDEIQEMWDSLNI